ncbi:MAG TPA: type-F conjugative transfer system pilin assembly protein TrbC [Candidatus Thiothrix moscowensis]|uniref:type-F conjugative transfer system pilin assembly protein TrbC n=1 Tax=unclassified Thiothrix TaxID=2636184 RepID=UPI0025CEDFBB|nr:MULTISPECIES: type-F conjugative transfer system pilin assembly protein TrbC [unclassified Thiothrix]HRJ52242.1 type-F conjugative transfer system pilin assembly protein TrbC [Candidatus Thiothrix moscowensis]HRJ92557.1 type-F conjugative transfer system pilin assembly protein TrbC [Candidatus Thiothrix moscowensis]
MLRFLILPLWVALLPGIATGQPIPVDTPAPGWQEALQALDSGGVPVPALPDWAEVRQVGVVQQQQAQSVIDRLMADAITFPSTPQQPLVPLVFVSMSMPNASLRLLLADAAKIGAQLVLNGLVDDDVQATAGRLLEIQGIDPKATSLPDGMQAVAGMVIDPTLFSRLGIRQVPTFVLPAVPPAACVEGQGCPVFRHVRLSGDVRLAYALEQFAGYLKDVPDWQTPVQQWLKVLQGGTP